MVVALFITSLLSLFLPMSALAGPHGSGPRHHELARRVEGNMQLYHRSSGARMTWYDTETGAPGSCGTYLSNSGWTVALNAAEMNSKLCFVPIIITYNGKSTTATIVDTCPGCLANGGLDLSPSLFADLAGATNVGVITGDWAYANAAPSPTPTPTPSPSPSPVWSPSPSPSPVWSPSPSPVWSPSPSPSPVWSPSPSPSPSSTSQTSTPSSTKSSIPPTSSHTSSAPPSSTSSSVSTTSSTSSINYSSGPASGLAEPEPTGGTVPQDSSNNFDELFRVFICFGSLVVAAHGD